MDCYDILMSRLKITRIECNFSIFYVEWRRLNKMNEEKKGILCWCEYNSIEAVFCWERNETKINFLLFFLSIRQVFAIAKWKLHNKLWSRILSKIVFDCFFFLLLINSSSFNINFEQQSAEWENMKNLTN